MSERCLAVRDDLALLALGLIQDGECAPLLEHLRECNACRRYFDETMVPGVEVLAGSVAQLQPPPSLKGKILDAVRNEQRAVEINPSSGTSGKVAVHRPVSGAHSAPVAHRNDRRNIRGIRLSWQWVAILVLGLTNLWALSENQALRTEMQRFRVVQAQTEAQLQAAQSLLLDAETQPSIKVALAGTDSAPAAQGWAAVYTVEGEHYVLLSVNGLPPLSGEQAYQAWLIRDGKRTNAGTFLVDRMGRGGLVYRTEQPFEFQALGITLEPDALGDQPRGTKVLGATFQQT